MKVLLSPLLYFMPGILLLLLPFQQKMGCRKLTFYCLFVHGYSFSLLRTPANQVIYWRSLLDDEKELPSFDAFFHPFRSPDPLPNFLSSTKVPIGPLASTILIHIQIGQLWANLGHIWHYLVVITSIDEIWSLCMVKFLLKITQPLDF